MFKHEHGSLVHIGCERIERIPRVDLGRTGTMGCKPQRGYKRAGRLFQEYTGTKVDEIVLDGQVFSERFHLRNELIMILCGEMPCLRVRGDFVGAHPSYAPYERLGSHAEMRSPSTFVNSSTRVDIRSLRTSVICTQHSIAVMGS